MRVKKIKWRNERISSLVLGAAQLGMLYGIANKYGKPSEELAEKIIKKAYFYGINFIDTAQAYGESEEIIGNALKNLKISKNIKIISKLSPSADIKSKKTIEGLVKNSITKLGITQLWGFMLHNADLFKQWNDNLGKTFEGLKKNGYIKYLGVSVYTPEQAITALKTKNIDIIQVPCNPFDIRMLDSNIFQESAELNKLCFIRSIYLQGLLLMPLKQVKNKLPQAYEISKAWNSLTKKYHLSKMEFAAKFAKMHKLPIVIGVEHPTQIERNVKLFSSRPFNSKIIHEIREILSPLVSEEIINPSKWVVQS